MQSSTTQQRYLFFQNKKVWYCRLMQQGAISLQNNVTGNNNIFNMV